MTGKPDRRLQITAAGLAIAVVGLASGWLSDIVQDRQDVAVSLRILQANDDRVTEDLSDIKDALSKLADQSAEILVLQEQVSANHDEIDKLSRRIERRRDEMRGLR